MHAAAAGVLFALLSLHCIQSDSTSKNVLVLIENAYIKDTHSSFINLLSDNGYNVTIHFADESSLNLKNLGEYIYSHIILLAPSANEFGGSLGVKDFLKFIDEGGNLVVVASPTVGVAIRELASECGVEFDEESTAVIDHFHHDEKDNGAHTLLVVPSDNLVNSTVITGRKPTAPFLYRGIGISADVNNPLLVSVLHASSSSYSYSPMKPLTDYPNTVGTNTQLITALQARNNVRALFIGSMEFLSNKFFESEVETLPGQKRTVCGNKELTANLLRWVLGECGQLREAWVKHTRVGEAVPPNQYTIMDNVVYTIKIETKDDAGKWVPYISDDVQLEFVRIDPFIRKTLQSKNGEYQLVMKLPDIYGVFKFVVDYHRLGYTHLRSVIQVPVRPFTYTQYERFIPAAYPYYVSALSMVFCFVLFSLLFLYSKDDKEKSE